jgi:hypothetical protein
LEASSESLKQGGAPVEFAKRFNGNIFAPPLTAGVTPRVETVKMSEPELRGKKRPRANGRKIQIKIGMNDHKS